MKICIYGAGAIGGTIAVRLAQAGHEVSVVARGAHLAAIRQNGLTLQKGDERVTARVPAAADGAEFGVQDAVILAVKAHGIRAALAGLAPLIGADTSVVPAVNGVPWWFFERWGGALAGTRLGACDPDGAIARAIPYERIIGGIVYLAADSPAPGELRHNSGNRIVLGEPGEVSSARVDALVAALSGAGFEAKATERIREEVWKKLWGNVCFNPVSVLTGSSTDRMIDDPLLNAMFVTMMGEVLAVAGALGLSLDMQPVERIALARRLGGIKTSMLQDALAGRSLEVDAIVGAVVEIAKRLDIPVPMVDAVYGMTRLHAASRGLQAPR
ncbi:MAG: 2-dehydropantoate 2-reductase [Burkholderiales bacterium]|nr:2-dehydropantoate 2-reductase [Burkholderiales bacterium]